MIHRTLSRQFQPLLFLAFALVAAGIAYPVYRAATSNPAVELRGFIMVLVNDPTAEVQVQVQYASYLTKDPELSFRHPNLGTDDVVAAILSVSGRTPSTDVPTRFLILLGGDSALHDPYINHADTRIWSAPNITIRSRFVSARSDIQAFEGEVSGQEGDPTIAGTVRVRVADVAAGRTFVRIPTLGSVQEALRWEKSTVADPDLKEQDFLVNDTKWYTPKEIIYTADVGRVPVGVTLADARPEADDEDPTMLRWRGRELDFPQARIVDEVAVQSAANLVFISGILGGVAGGLFVEGITRFRFGWEKRQQAPTTTPEPAKRRLESEVEAAKPVDASVAEHPDDSR